MCRWRKVTLRRSGTNLLYIRVRRICVMKGGGGGDVIHVLMNMEEHIKDVKRSI